MKKESEKIGLNDIVEVEDDGYEYSSYYDMATFMGLKKWDSGYPIRHDIIDHEYCNLYRVIFIQPYDNVKNTKIEDIYKYDILLCGIENIESGNQHIIGIEGLSLKRKSLSLFFNESDFLL